MSDCHVEPRNYGHYEPKDTRKKNHDTPLRIGGEMWYNIVASVEQGGFRTLCPGLGKTGLNES